MTAGVGDAALHQHALFLLAGNGLARTYPQPDLPPVTDGRKIRGAYLDHSHLPGFEIEPAHRQCRQRKNVSVGAQRPQVLQQLIADLRSIEPAVVIHADDQVAWLAMARIIVGKGTHGLGELVRLVDRYRSLDPIGFEIGQQSQQCFLVEHGAHSSDMTNPVTGAGKLPVRRSSPTLGPVHAGAHPAPRL